MGMEDTQISRVVEPELVGLEPPPQSCWRRTLARAAFATLLGALGLALIAIGVVLTLTIVGALVGIPMIIVGSMLLIAVIFVPFGSGEMRVVSVRPPSW